MVLTIKQLHRHENTLWALTLIEPASDADSTLWWALHELALLLNEIVDLETFHTKHQRSYLVIWGGQAYFKEQGKPRPWPVERLMLRYERYNLHLDPDV